MKPVAFPLWRLQFLTGGLCLITGQLAHFLVGSDLAPIIFWPPAGIALGAALVWGLGTWFARRAAPAQA